MRGSVSTTGTGQGRGLWPVLLLLMAAVVVPTACLLWFMSVAVRNERVAVEQRLSEAYERQMEAARREVESRWRDRAERLQASQANVPAPELFAQLVTEGVCDSAVVRSQTQYPAVAAQQPPVPGGEEPAWVSAGKLEFVESDYLRAADAYERLALEGGNTNLAGRALQAWARCLVKAGRRDEAVAVLVEQLGRIRFRSSRDTRGNLIVPSGLLMALDLMGGPQDPRYEPMVGRLARQVVDYSPPVMPSAQRLFLMGRMLEIRPSEALTRLTEAEQIAADYMAQELPEPAPERLELTPLAGVWRLASADGSGVGLYRFDRVAEEARSVLALNVGPGDVSVQVLKPGEEVGEREPFILAKAGPYLPDWRLALFLKGADPFADATRHQVAVYTWTAALVMGFTAFITIVVGRYLLQQTRLTRLKNDFIATVSHELKTPLASMRVLVDTLLSGHYNDQQQVTDYLQLIASENQRLSRLIDNFLSFSRMERNKRAFVLEDIAPGDVAHEAAEVVRSRFADAGVLFEVDVADHMPAVSGDFDALVTVLVNLLDNSFKYTDDEKAITLRAEAQNGKVRFQVADNGIGMSRRAARRIFDRFYQVDQSLSRRTEGCGLGLSIVKFIVDAHRGTIDVESEPGRGSKFTITLPALAGGEDDLEQ